ncbi:acyl-CoA dehydrogenase family protein [Gordonia rubripertincta]|uniref:acyl-CoA dehydrogenase family protein n=1 Tax=Gordonia rubripertincta TaxID=36822 RepID=UPI0015F9B812|nr:acyl-CoA dehydrogenase family protein [Gordonia rubripertincta]QMU21009.1 acyl-CoA/acyl-ACP dehydrogenase [Gordonia rubripertincta]
MELAWGEDFAALSDVSKSVFARYSPLEDRSNSVPFADQVAQFAELGWLQLGDPSGVDPDSPSLTTIAGIFVEMGRALASTPLLDLMTSRDAALLIGTDEAVGVAKRIGNGESTVVPVFPSADWGSRVSYDDGLLNGVALAVEHADRAGSFLVHAGGPESVVVLVESGSSIGVEAMPNMGGHPMFEVIFDNVPVLGDVLARGAEADRAVEVAGQRAAVLRAAQVYGAGLKLLDMTVLYAQQRHQFGGPIGRFQAVQYLCTDIAVAAHLTSVHARAAAAALDAGRDPQPHLGLMRRQAAKAALEIVHSAHEVHAGIGYMVESNVHLFTDAAKRWQFDFGSAAQNDAEIVSALDRIYAEDVR